MPMGRGCQNSFGFLSSTLATLFTRAWACHLQFDKSSSIPHSPSLLMQTLYYLDLDNREFASVEMESVGLNLISFVKLKVTGSGAGQAQPMSCYGSCHRVILLIMNLIILR